jgi:hypothetical protein
VWASEQGQSLALLVPLEVILSLKVAAQPPFWFQLPDYVLSTIITCSVFPHFRNFMVYELVISVSCKSFG